MRTGLSGGEYGGGDFNKMRWVGVMIIVFTGMVMSGCATIARVSRRR